MKNTLLNFALSSICLLGFEHGYSQCSAPSGVMLLNQNNVQTLTHSAGDLYWDFTQSQYEVPKGSGLSTTFSGGLWLAGTDLSGQLKMAVAKYRNTGSDYYAGPIDANGQTLNCNDFDRVWPITRSEVSDFRSNPTLTTQNIMNWPGRNNPNLAYTKDVDLAPFVDVDNDGNYNPLNGDYPDFKGDGASFSVFNDIGNLHTESGSDQMGVEVHLMAYAYSTNNQVNNATFYEYTIKNKGANDLFDMNIGIFTDFDLGGSRDDLVGCDINRNLGYIYNGDGLDEDAGGVLGYGKNPPLAGIKMVGLPTKENNTYSMNSFKALGSSPNTDPNLAIHYYNLLNGMKMNGGFDTLPNGDSVLFQYSGIPGGTGISECSSGNAPGERKILMNFGTFDFAQKEEITFTFANIYARGTNPNYSTCVDGISVLQEAADTVQAHFDDVKRTTNINSLSNQSESFNIFPNPVQSQITLDKLHEGSRIEIINAQGGLVDRVTINNDHVQIDVSEYNQGIYFIKATDKNNRSQIKKFVKE
ncbi:MAG: T9SS type A sorting domain-containing protein [Salibacteraceae bacterium]